MMDADLSRLGEEREQLNGKEKEMAEKVKELQGKLDI